MSKANLTNDELRDDVRAGLLEVESRLNANILTNGASTRPLRRIKLAHALLYDAEEEVHAEGNLVERSPADDKD